ncbi:Predicted arabinose efflux permease, MFS family [Nocardioides exalbidus]|uniref:Predicted arabinose efflux permease, MFS family n=1 Tax=Nocardioides exalbidus TaxID=402596 RepID=A0A1H4I388_9ACTN|nr:Predicted arabinose efflux permease, MFS family [Nocardioides exalbidus]
MKRSLSFLSSRDGWLVVAGCGLIAGTYGLVRLAYGLFLPDIDRSVPLGTATAGFIASGSSVAYCVGALAGVVLDGRPRALLVASVATASGGAVAMALAPGLALLAPAVVVASTGAGLASPGLVAVVARTVSPQRADAAQATVNAGTGPGLVAAGVLALVMPDWRAAFVLSAAVTALAGGGVLLLDRGSVRPATGSRTPAHGGAAALTALGVPAIAAILMGAASAVRWTYGRTQLAATGAGDTTTVLAWIALGAGGTATVLTAGRLASLSPQRAWLITSAVVAASTAGLGLTDAPALVHGMACFGFGWGFVAASSALIAWASRVVPARGAAGTSVLFVALVLGQAVGAALAGVVADGFGMSTAFLLSALVALGAAACGRD